MTNLMTGQRFSILLLAAALTGGLSACANMEAFKSSELAVPPDSPVAVAAREAQHNPGPWPTFAQVRRVEQKSQAPARTTLDNTRILAEADRLTARAAATPPANPAAIEAFAAQQKAAVSAVPVPAESTAAEIEAFAAAARARAIPPPPPS